MKVLYIAGIEEVGGSPKSMLTLIRILKEKGVEPIVITPIKNGYVMKTCQENQIEVHYVKHYKLSYSLGKSRYKNLIKMIASPFYSLYTFLGNMAATRRVEQLIDVKDIKLIHTNLPRYEIGIMLSKKYNIKHIVHLREYGTLDFNCRYLRPKYYQYLNKNTYKFIAISESIKRFFVEKGLDEEKVAVIYNGVERNIPTIDYNLRKNENNIKVVVSSNISEEKGQIQVIKSISNLKDYNIDLYLYGKCEKSYFSYLEDTIKKLNLENKIHFLGYRDNIQEDLKEYDIAITPSKAEAFGRVTIEYMLAKLPIIVSNTGANSEIILDNECGFVYNYGDINDLSHKISQLINSFELRKKFGEKGYIRAINYFTADKNADNIYKLYIEDKGDK